MHSSSFFLISYFFLFERNLIFEKCRKIQSYLTVLNEFKLISRYFNCFKSLNVDGGTELIPFRLRSKICRDFKFSKWDDSNFWIMFDDKFNNFKLLTSCSATVGKTVIKFSDRSSFSNDEAPWNSNLNWSNYLAESNNNKTDFFLFSIEHRVFSIENDLVSIQNRMSFQLKTDYLFFQIKAQKFIGLPQKHRYWVESIDFRLNRFLSVWSNHQMLRRRCLKFDYSASRCVPKLIAMQMHRIV